MDVQKIKPEQFEGLSGPYVLPGRYLVQMFGLNPDLCQVTIDQNRLLSIAQSGENLTLAIAPEFWRYSRHSSQDPAIILEMEFSEFLDSELCARLQPGERRALKKRASDFTGQKINPNEKTPYLVRDFLEDFPNEPSLMKIYMIGAIASMKFAHILIGLGLPFKL